MQKTILFFLIVNSFLLKSQITITPNQMPVSGDTIRYSNATLSSLGNYTLTGTNHIWHFDTLRPISQSIREFKSGLNTPYFILFGITAYGEKTIDTVPIPNIPVLGLPTISITDVYNFYKKSPALLPTKFVAEGLGLKLSGIPVPNTFSDEDELYFFPLNYGNRDSSTFRFSTISNTLIPFRYIKQGYRITEADGWGTVTTPYGTANCLRVITTQYSIDTIKGTVTIPGFGTQPFAFGFKNYQRSYQWLSLGEHIPFLEVSGTLNNTLFTPTQVKYRDISRAIVGVKEENNNFHISVFPNPATNQFIILTPRNSDAVNVKILDLQGKTIIEKELIQNLEPLNQHLIDVSSLAKGMYIVNISSTQGQQSLKISVQ